MQNTVYALEKLLPEAIRLFKERYLLLQTILECGPIGRRGLASILDLSERTIRKEVDVLTEQGLIHISHLGIVIAEEGEKLLDTLYLPLQMLEEFSALEKDVSALLDLKQAIIVKGNVDTNEEVKNKLGRACASVLSSVLKDDTTMAITGGTTIFKMVESMPKQHYHYKNLMVIPARGSVGNKAEFQANTVAVELAKRLGADYELLTIPDNLSTQSINLIKSEPQIQKILQKIAKTDIIIFGIGNAMKMATRRKESEEVLNILTQKQATAEAFRHYFDAKGQVVYATQSIGVAPDIARTIPIKIAVAGGVSKANAILATRALLKNSYLILDEAAAREIVKKMTHDI
ncbi:sugar-binding transcriptional regulator [Cellulosilyticum sp. I15G10I2]|uniref:sugar-binding transcriptional regulator n=1 Tax=Cellulosilyticum sp. I15G10I2 TaxID=1892843 RepID=UPI00085C2446|nr:sugar-binding domain-containing protein [Cellulosilyticum sp. I15G10I2]